MSSVALEPIFHSNPRRRIPKITPKFRKSKQLSLLYSPKPLKIGGRIPEFGGPRFSPVKARGNDDPSTVSGHGDDVVFSRTFPFRWTKAVEGKIYTRLDPGEKEGHWELTVGCNLPGRWILHWGVYLVGHDGSEWDQPPRQMRPPGSVAVEDYAVDTPMKAVTSKEEGHFQEVKIDINTFSPVASINFVLRDEETGSWFQHMGGDFKVPLVGYLNDSGESVPPKWGFSFFQDALGQLSGRLPKSKGADPDSRQRKSPEVFYEEQHVLKEISLENSIKVSVRKSGDTAKNLMCIETDLPEDVVVQWCVCKDDQSRREIPALPHPPDTVIFQNKVLCTRLQPKKGGHGYRGIFTLEKDLSGFHFLIRLRDHNLKYMENEYFVPLQITAADQIEDREVDGGGLHDSSPQPNSGDTPIEYDQEIPESSTLYTNGLIKNIRDLVSDISSEKGSIRRSRDNQENLLSEIEKLAAEAYSIFRTNIPGFPEATKYSGSRSGLPSVKLHSGTGTGYEILCQGFNWESNKSGKWYMELREKADYLSALGFTIIWLPPPTESISPEGYMPKDLYNLNSKYGTVEELRAVIEKFHEVGIKVLGDVVLNHRCAQYQDHNGVWNVFGGRLNWDAHAIVGDDPHFHGKGNKSSGDNFHAAPNIDHSQDFVRRDIKEWMRWLKNEVGYDGWRLDFVRGFWGGYVKEYLDATEPYFAVGEYWDSLSYTYSEMDYDQNAHRQRIIDWINAAGGNAGAFDVTTKGVLHSSVENCQYWRLRDPKGKPPGVVGWWPSRAVTFIENHDTGSTQGHWRFPSGREMQGYAYILTHPGTPSIFYDHFYSSLHEEICKLIYLRRRNKLHCRSNLQKVGVSHSFWSLASISRARGLINHNLHVAQDMGMVKIVKAETDAYAAIIDEKVAMKIGPGHYEPPSDRKWSKSLEGDCYKVWETTLKESKRTGTRSAKHR